MEDPTLGEKSTNLSEIVEYSVSVLLVHSSVDIKARIAKIGNFLGQKFDSLKKMSKVGAKICGVWGW